MKNKILQLIDFYETELKSFFVLFAVGLCILILWFVYRFVPTFDRKQKLEKRQIELVGRLLSYEIKDKISQSDIGNEVIPSSLKLVYEFDFKGEKHKKEEFILWNQLTQNEKAMIKSSASFCIKIKISESDPKNGKAIILRCEK